MATTTIVVERGWAVSLGQVPATAEPAVVVPPEPGQPIAGSIGLRLVDAPASAVDDPRAQVYIVDHLAPGTVIQRRVEITNGTSETAHVALYSTAATITQGTFVGEPEGTDNPLSSWTSVTPDSADIAADARLMATVTVSIPPDAAPGEQYAVVWAEVRSAPANGTGLTQVSRVGIRLYISVGPGNAPAADFIISSLTAERSADGTPVVVATVRNTGGRALDLSGSLQLDDGPAGLSAGPYPATLGVTLAIGAVDDVSIPLDAIIPAGPWQATITLHSGLTERQATAPITFSMLVSSAPVPAREIPRSASSSSRSVIVAVALVLVAMWAGVVYIRRRKRRPAEPA